MWKSKRKVFTYRLPQSKVRIYTLNTKSYGKKDQRQTMTVKSLNSSSNNILQIAHDHLTILPKLLKLPWEEAERQQCRPFVRKLWD